MLTANFSSDTLAPRNVPLEDDWLTFVHTSKDSLEFELGLFATKWFDYRHLTGVEATKLYIEAYGKVYKDIYAREIDYERAKHVKPFDVERILAGLANGDPKARRIWKGCWRGRQVADFLGMPYDVYIDMAFTFRMRRWNQRHMPQPQHLFHEFDVEKIQAKWEELQQSTLYTSEHPAYAVENYLGAAHQNDYHEWLIKQAMHRSNPPYFLHRFIRAGQLTVEKVKARIDEAIFERLEVLLLN